MYHYTLATNHSSQLMIRDVLTYCIQCKYTKVANRNKFTEVANGVKWWYEEEKRYEGLMLIILYHEVNHGGISTSLNTRGYVSRMNITHFENKSRQNTL